MDAHVFDRAAFHRDTVAGHGLPESQAWVHSGILFGWAVERGLVASWLRDRTPDAFRAFADRTLTGPGLLAAWDGNLLDDMFNDEGLAFLAAYWTSSGDPEFGSYIEDYRSVLVDGLASDYHVEDTWQNYRRMVDVLDARHARFRATFDPTAPRVDLRQGPAAVNWLGPGWLPTILVPHAVALPQATIGLVAAQPETVAALDYATTHAPGWVVLRMPDLSVGVAATVERWEGDRALLNLFTRVHSAGSPHETAPISPSWWVERRREPAWNANCEGWVNELRTRVGQLVTRRREAGKSPGALALALAHSELALVDAVAADLLEDGEARREVLCASRADDRVRIVVEALRRATA